MKNTRRGAAAWLAALTISLSAHGSGSALAGERAAEHPAKPVKPRGSATQRPVTAETVYFADRGRAVQLLRGGDKRKPPPQIAAHRTEIVGFGSSSPLQVTVVRGGAAPASVKPPEKIAAAANPLPPKDKIETVNFTNPALPAVTVVRGTRPAPPFTGMMSVELFGPANSGELDRVAFAVDGVESRHGADRRMWRPEPDGPQGPMQVSAKAAIDVGGGDRFDLQQNRLLGRAYLAQMYRRYGNWPDALGAYNWGPGNLDQWIAGGRNPLDLPLETARYILRVMRDALIITTARL